MNLISIKTVNIFCISVIIACVLIMFISMVCIVTSIIEFTTGVVFAYGGLFFLSIFLYAMFGEINEIR